MKAATPPFATKEPAADEAVEEEAAEVVGEAGEGAGEGAVDTPLVGELAVGMPMEAVDPPAALDPPVAPVSLAALNPEDAVTEPDTNGGEWNRIACRGPGPTPGCPCPS